MARRKWPASSGVTCGLVPLVVGCTKLGSRLAGSASTKAHRRKRTSRLARLQQRLYVHVRTWQRHKMRGSTAIPTLRSRFGSQHRRSLGPAGTYSAGGPGACRWLLGDGSRYLACSHCLGTLPLKLVPVALVKVVPSTLELLTRCRWCLFRPLQPKQTPVRALR